MRARYKHRMRKLKWGENHFRFLRLRRMTVRSNEEVAVSVGSEGLQWMAEWCESSSILCKSELLTPSPCSRSANYYNTNGQPGRGQHRNEKRDTFGTTETLASCRPNACGITALLAPYRRTVCCSDKSRNPGRGPH